MKNEDILKGLNVFKIDLIQFFYSPIFFYGIAKGQKVPHMEFIGAHTSSMTDPKKNVIR